ncbi:MAG TPA: exodeoxyribonuclease III [Pseudomonadales bacterium]|nr:exodeoxyribonuclease III [Pseudomonadales bacterium]
MKLVSFNINGLRARPHQLEQLIADYAPDIIGLQETKVVDEQFPLELIKEMGYHCEYFGQKSHYGVALMSKQPPKSIQKGFPTDAEDAQRRLITGVYGLPGGEDLIVINGYFPQGESRDHPQKFPAKQKFYSDLNQFLQQHFSPQQKVVVMGDLNISATDDDIGIGADNAKRWLKTGKCSFLPEEREWLNNLQSWGLVDTYRVQNPSGLAMSWFDYRSRGFEDEPKRGLRIDSILVTDALKEKLLETGICLDIRGMEKPSDHAPVWAKFAL